MARSRCHLAPMANWGKQPPKPSAAQQHPNIIPCSTGKGHGGMGEHPEHPERPQGRARISFAGGSSSLLFFFKAWGHWDLPEQHPPPSTSSHQPHLKLFAVCSCSRASSPGTPLLLGALHLHLLIKTSPKIPSDSPELSPPRVGAEPLSGEAERGSCDRSRYSKGNCSQETHSWHAGH